MKGDRVNGSFVRRLSRSLRKHINRRAFELAGKAYARYRDELEAAIAEDTALIDKIDSWRPSNQRAGRSGRRRRAV